MNNFFNKKAMFGFIALFLIFTVIGGIFTASNIKATAEFNNTAKKSNVANILQNVLSYLTTASSDSTQTTEEATTESEYTPEQQKLLNKSNATKIGMITFFILAGASLVFASYSGVSGRKEKENLPRKKGPGSKKTA